MDTGPIKTRETDKSETTSTLGDPAQSLRHHMVVDPKEPGDPGNQDAPPPKLNSLQCHRLINRGHDRIAKLNNQR